MVETPGPVAETALFGRALKALRQRAGMTLAEAAEGVETAGGEGISAQAFSMYERGERISIHQPDTLDRMLRAVCATREMFHEELGRLGSGAAPAPGLQEAPAPFTPPTQLRPMAVAVAARFRQDAERNSVVVEAARPDGVADLAWLFAPTTGHLRMPDDRLKGRVEAGQLVHFDRTMPPRTGQVCVVEAEGALHVYEYGESTQGKVTVVQRHPEATVEFDRAEIRGVYAARMWGD